MGRQKQPSEEHKETVLLVGVTSRRASEWEVTDSLDELKQLVQTAGGEVHGNMICRQEKAHPRYFIGQGKATEIAEIVHAEEIDTVVFDDDLTPAQGRNLEQLIDTKVIDRTQVILDIFALHAHTKDGRLQIDLARLEYLLPRLRRMWTHLERQRGGIGVRGGPGEQQIEVDRRRIQERITRLKLDLKDVKRHRAEIRRGRRRHGWALISIVGYTNAGKSTLLNHLTDSHVVTNDQLFVTLDPTTRKVELPNHQPALITDTVGFIKKLPHHLVEAFKATLEEVSQADLLIHVIDASHPRAEVQIEAVNNVLKELDADEKPVLHVLNKIDREEGRLRWKSLARDLDTSTAISARTGEGMEHFLETLADCLRDRNVEVHLRIPHSASKLIATLRGSANITSEEYEGDYLLLQGRVPRRLAHLCEPYAVDKPSEAT